jgi:hypothetical protein
MQTTLKEFSFISSIFKYLLLFPSYDDSGKAKVLWLIFHLFFPIGLVTFTFVFIKFVQPIFWSDNLGVWIAYVVLFGELLTFLVSLLSAFFTRKYQKKIYSNMAEIDELFLKNNFWKHSRSHQWILFKLSLIALILLCLKINVLYFSGTNIKFYLHLFVPSLHNQLKCLQLTFYLEIIDEKLAILHQNLNFKNFEIESCLLVLDCPRRPRNIPSILFNLKKAYGELQSSIFM